MQTSAWTDGVGMDYVPNSINTTTLLGGDGKTAPTQAGTYTVVAHSTGSSDYLAGDSTPAPFHISPATPALTASV